MTTAILPIKKSLPAPRGFTLVELLVVISIIGILAALLLPVLNVAKQRTLVRQAQLEIRNIEAGVNQYLAEYSRPPSPTNVIADDFTFGTIKMDATIHNNNKGVTLAKVGTDLPFKGDNSLIVAILMNMERYPAGGDTINKGFVKNPRKIIFLANGKMVSDQVSSGIGSDLVYRDPWGNPYIISIDFSGDDQVFDSFYSQGRVSAAKRNIGTGLQGSYEVRANAISRYAHRGSVMVWSLGPDGKADDKLKANAGVNKDNVVSWK